MRKIRNEPHPVLQAKFADKRLKGFLHGARAPDHDELEVAKRASHDLERSDEDVLALIVLERTHVEDEWAGGQQVGARNALLPIGAQLVDVHAVVNGHAGPRLQRRDRRPAEALRARTILSAPRRTNRQSCRSNPVAREAPSMSEPCSEMMITALKRRSRLRRTKVTAAGVGKWTLTTRMS